MKIDEAIECLEKKILDPSQGLPEDVFYFASRITPLVNVDLLIKDKQNRTLLTWREDSFGPLGWHVPGGIIRYKERLEDRIKAVANSELGCEVEFDSAPLAINELILDRKTRGHFISLLYNCRLLTPLDEKIKCCNPESPGSNEWQWHDFCPANLIPVHDDIYREFI